MVLVRVLSEKLQRKANEELNEDPTRIEENLNHIKEWLSKQPHLNIGQDDQLLITFGRGCKWSLQRVKEKMDSFCTLRRLTPEFFTNRDPFSPEMQSALKAGVFCPLPNTTNPAGPVLVFQNFANVNVEEIPNLPLIVTKLFFMTLDVLMHENDNLIVAGVEAIIDYKHFPLSAMVQCTPSMVLKSSSVMENAYPVRFKRCVSINVASMFDTLVNLMMRFLSDKIKKRMMFFSEANMDKVYKEFDKSVFPKEYGGENGSLAEAAQMWKTKLESYREWFLDDEKYKSIEELRLGKCKYSFEENSMEGSFRKLDID